MITQKLEELIWAGKAWYKTFVAGGAERSLLNIENDRFIIITDITYFSCLPSFDDPNLKYNTIQTVYNSGQNTQLTVLGEKGVNRFLFRNGYTTVGIDPGDELQSRLLPNGSTCINTYLLHTTQVAFTFSAAGNHLAQFVGLVPAENTAYPPPTDYGKDGQPGALPVTLNAQWPSAGVYENTYIDRPTANVDSATELAFPVDSTTQLGVLLTNPSWGYPIAQISYVEVLGQSNNIGL